MPRWELHSYNEREIKTEEDLLWMAKELEKVFKNNKRVIEMKDIMALSFLKEVWREKGEEWGKRILEKNKIQSRFDILDIR